MESIQTTSEVGGAQSRVLAAGAATRRTLRSDPWDYYKFLVFRRRPKLHVDEARLLQEALGLETTGSGDMIMQPSHVPFVSRAPRRRRLATLLAGVIGAD
jgi:hypothetical protein